MSMNEGALCALHEISRGCCSRIRLQTFIVDYKRLSYDWCKGNHSCLHKKIMTRSYCRLWTHAVFVTKNRLPLIPLSTEKEVHNYMYGQLKKMDCEPLIINGMANHVHLLFLANYKVSMADIAKQVKGSTSHWINTNNIVRDKFGWTDGIYSQSVSESVVDGVKQYIANQKTHHAKRTFAKEWEELENELRCADFDLRQPWDLSRG